MKFGVNKLTCKLLFVISALCLTSCASVTSSHVKSFTINQEQSANVGASMIAAEDITYEKHWVGVMFSPTGYQTIATEDSFKEELIYTGRSDNIINVSYREYKQNFARPAFYQELHYDLGKSNIIVFRNYRIKVLDANNEQITFKVLAN